jgi:pSer/pThr/pTyr-binding forkhead associated (FHA) protein
VPPGSKVSSVFVLEVLGGPLDGKTWEFDREIIIGRDESLAAACITLDRYVSRKHAKLRLQEAGDALTISDLASRNGTKVGGRAVTSEAAIQVGEQFVVGRTQLRVLRKS